MLLLYELFSIFWMSNFNILVFINGLKADFFYAFLMFIVPYFLNDDKNLNKLYKLAYYSILFIFSLQIFQLLFPSIANTLTMYNVNDEYLTVSHSGHSFGAGYFIEYLKTYFFSSAKMSDMVTHLYLIFVLLALYINNFKPRVIILVTVVVFFMLFLTGKRIYIILFPLFLLVFIFLLYKYSFIIKNNSMGLYYKYIKLKRLFVTSLIISLACIFILFFTNERIEILFSFIYEAMSTGFSERFLTSNSMYGGSFFELLKLDHLFYGQGVGTNTQGVSQLNPSAQEYYSGFEMGYFKFINEHGILGFILFILFIFSIFYFDIKSYLVNKKINFKIISLLILTYHFISFLRYFNGHQFFGSSQTIFWFWFLMGFQIFIYHKARLDESKNINSY